MKRGRSADEPATAAAAAEEENDEGDLPKFQLGEGLPCTDEESALAWCTAHDMGAGNINCGGVESAATLLRACTNAPAARALARRLGPSHTTLSSALVALVGSPARVAVTLASGRRVIGSVARVHGAGMGLTLSPGWVRARRGSSAVALSAPAATPLRLAARRALAVEALGLAAPWPAVHHRWALQQAGLVTRTGERRVGAGGAAARL